MHMHMHMYRYEASTNTVDPHMVYELHMRAPHTPWSDPIHMVASLEEGLSEDAWGEGTMSEVIALERLLRADERPGSEGEGREGGRGGREGGRGGDGKGYMKKGETKVGEQCIQWKATQWM